MAEKETTNVATEEKETTSTPESVTAPQTVDTKDSDAKDAKGTQGGSGSPSGAHKGGFRGGQQGERRRNPRRQRRGGRRDERSRPEFEQKIISIRRVTRVMAGGRRFSFSVAMVAGDKKGKIGVGVGKAGDTQLAIEKAFRSAKKNMITVKMDKDHHIAHDVDAKYASSVISILPAPGRGLVAGSSVRTVLELAGVKDVTAKVFSRSKNKLNNARAAIQALKALKE